MGERRPGRGRAADPHPGGHDPALADRRDALTRTDDLLALRAVSDERAAEVARLASDRERLLTEVVAPRAASAPGSPSRCTTGRCSDRWRYGRTLPTSGATRPSSAGARGQRGQHAAPSGIDVMVRDEPGRLVLEINDDGVGIDTERADRAVQAGHVGLAMVRRRVEDAGGEFSIATRPDGGTRSRVVLPRRL